MMIESTIAAYLFSFLTCVVVIFQFALAVGAPWGEMTMGGKFPGQLPPIMRAIAIVQVAILVFLEVIVLTRAGLVFEEYLRLSKSMIWVVVVFCAMGSILNTITSSKKERLLWAPVNIALLICAFAVTRS